jgi:predicted phosphodiesterase
VIGIIGDVHSRDQDLENALDWLKGRGIMEIYCVGDLTDGPGEISRCISLLREARVPTILGNHDQWCLKGANLWYPEATRSADLTRADRTFLEGLPLTLTPYPEVLLCHGLGTNIMGRVNPDDYGYGLEVNDGLQNLIKGGTYRLILNGHSHRPMVRTFAGLTIVNAGALGVEGGMATVSRPLVSVRTSAKARIRQFRYFLHTTRELANSPGQPVTSCPGPHFP